jgi:hypothetical protein
MLGYLHLHPTPLPNEQGPVNSLLASIEASGRDRLKREPKFFALRLYRNLRRFAQIVAFG